MVGQAFMSMPSSGHFRDISPDQYGPSKESLLRFATKPSDASGVPPQPYREAPEASWRPESWPVKTRAKRPFRVQIAENSTS